MFEVFFKEMTNLSSVFSARNFLVLSLALNVSLILRVILLHDSQNQSSNGAELKEAHGSKITYSSVFSSSSSSSSFMMAQGDEDRVINLDQ